MRETNISSGFRFLNDAGGLYPQGWADMSLNQIANFADDYMINQLGYPGELVMPMLQARNDLETFLLAYIDPEQQLITADDPVVALKIDDDQEIESIYAPKIFAVVHEDQLTPCLRFGRKYITIDELQKRVTEQGGKVDVIFEQPPQGEGYPTLQWAFLLDDVFYIFEAMFRLDPKMNMSDFANIKMLTRAKSYDSLIQYLMEFDPNGNSGGKYARLKDLDIGQYVIDDIVPYSGKPEYDKFGFSLILQKPDGSKVQVNPNTAIGNELRTAWLSDSHSIFVGRVLEILDKTELSQGVVVKTRLMSPSLSLRTLNGGKVQPKAIESYVPVPEAAIAPAAEMTKAKKVKAVTPEIDFEEIPL